jgi:hypothetical protein
VLKDKPRKNPTAKENVRNPRRRKTQATRVEEDITLKELQKPSRYLTSAPGWGLSLAGPGIRSDGSDAPFNGRTLHCTLVH